MSVELSQATCAAAEQHPYGIGTQRILLLSVWHCSTADRLCHGPQTNKPDLMTSWKSFVNRACYYLATVTDRVSTVVWLSSDDNASSLGSVHSLRLSANTNVLSSSKFSSWRFCQLYDVWKLRSDILTLICEINRTNNFAIINFTCTVYLMSVSDDIWSVEILKCRPIKYWKLISKAYTACKP